MILQTIAQTPQGTFSEIYLNKRQKLYTVERPWVNNEPFISCIPAGDYRLEPHESRWGKTFALVNENLNVYHQKQDHGRYAIILHPANTATELQGCIAPGRSLGVINGKWAVLDSTLAWERLIDVLSNEPTLTIRRIS